MDYTQRGTVLYGSGTAFNLYGNAVAMAADGTQLFIGAPHEDYGGGIVDVYDYTGGAWVQRGLIFGSTYGVGNMGFSLIASRDGLVIATQTHIFDRSGSSWVPRGGMISGQTPLAFSGDGSVLIAGYFGDEGNVVTYDASGSTWVQRGADLQKIGAGLFGASAALSADGTVLVVGAPANYGPLGDPEFGSIYTFDLSGGTWVQRGAEMFAGDAAAWEQYGLSVALSSDGTRLAVGSLANKVYYYELSGSSWVQSGATLTNPLGFGASVAVSSDATVLAVGANKYTTSGIGVDSGGVYIYDGVAPASDTGSAVALTELTVIGASGIAIAPTELSVTGSGQAVAPAELAIIDIAHHWPEFSAAVTIDGVDVSAKVVGTISVEAEEGAARVAQFAILPGAGVLAPLDYVGKPVSIDYLLIISGAVVTRRIFTGRIDTPGFDPVSGRLSFQCVDDLQNRVAALDRAVIDALVGGRYSAAVQGDILDNWDYAQAMLTTVPASMDASASGGIRVTPWSIATAWATFSEPDLIYETSTVEFPQRSTLANKILISFDYRYPRLRQRYSSIGWSGTLVDMAPNGYNYPTQDDILGAAAGSGWTVTDAIFYGAPSAIAHSSGGFIYPNEDAVAMAILHAAQRHSQTVTESYSIEVNAPESITANGELRREIRGALDSAFDGGAWESALDVVPLIAGDGEMDYAPDAPRAASDHAIQTLLDQANVKILGTHRSARIGNSVLCNPDMDMDKKIAISTSQITASGKIVRVAHIIDLDAGSAITDFEIACFGVGGAGILTPDSLDVPAPPPAADQTQPWSSQLPALNTNTYGTTPYADGLMGLLSNPPATITVQDVPTVDGPQTISYANPYYSAGSYPSIGFRIAMPGVEDADRNPIEKSVSQSYSIIIPTDTVTITI